MSRRTQIIRITLALIIVGFWIVFGGCAQFEHRGYSPFVKDLDGLSELSITTYPAWFPHATVDIPFFYKRLVSPDSVYFKVFVRDAERKAGPNPHIDSIRIQSFSYRFGNGPNVLLIADYDQNFWMQNSPEYAQSSLDLSAIPYSPNMAVTIAIELTLNGESFSFQEVLYAQEQIRTYPLFLQRFE